MPVGRIVLKNGFPGWTSQFARGVYRGLGEVGEEIKQAAERQPIPHNYHIRGIVDTLRVSRVQRLPHGARVAVAYGDFRGIFFEKGTYQHRRAKLARGRRSTSTQRGVVAGHFLARGLRVAAPAAVITIAKHLP